jgi:chorismate mutase / prephenate dehydratase
VEENLKPLREEIDRLDSELIGLLNRRMELALEVGRIKALGGLSPFDPGREEIILQRLGVKNTGPLTEESLRAIYGEIFAASRLLQYVLEVAFLGPRWTFSHLAAGSLFGHSARYLPCIDLDGVFDSLVKRKVRIAVVPIENSLQGAVGRTMDLLFEHDVQVVRECYLEVVHYLCGSPQSVEGVRRVFAHPQAAEQCRRWIMENLRGAEIQECVSTARAAQMASEMPDGAAICNLYASQHYGLKVLAERIEDHPGNTTRFLALGHDAPVPSGNDKTSLLFAVTDQPGALHGALESLARAMVNMTRIESRPNRLLPWQYLFFADVEGHREDEKLGPALADFRERVTFLKILGSYPKSDPKRPIRLEKEKLRPGGKG